MSDFDKIVGFVSAAREAVDAFGEAVGDEGEVFKEGRTVRCVMSVSQ